MSLSWAADMPAARRPRPPREWAPRSRSSPIASRPSGQFRVLNRRKGPAVRGPRAQADRALYARGMQQAIRGTANLAVIEAEADDLLIRGERIAGLKLADGREFGAGAVVLTTGTFL